MSLQTSGNTAQHPVELNEQDKLRNRRVTSNEKIFDSRLTKLNDFIVEHLTVEVDPGLKILQPRVEAG